MSRKVIKEHQFTRAKNVINQAYTTVPYYNKVFKKAGITPDDIRTLDDLSKIPITRKNDIKDVDNSERLSCKVKTKKLKEHRTGGSTGIALSVFADNKTEDIRVANVFRSYCMHGYRMQDTIAVLQFHPIPKRMIDRFGICRRIEIPYNFTVSEQAALLKEIRPTILEGYPSRLNSLAVHMIERNDPGIAPRLIFTNSESLFDFQRENITRAFKVGPISIYDCWEFGTVAWECDRHKGLHVNDDLIYLETVDRNGRGVHNESGEIVITGLYNTAMPLIRYAMADKGVYSTKECDCGRQFSMLERIDGRKSDGIHLDDGREIPGIAQIEGVLVKNKGIKEFQAIQEKRGELIVRIVKNVQYREDSEKVITSELKRVIGLSSVKIIYVDSIMRTEVGKYKLIMSLID
ncbi:MAG: phenylacetate--CoA ligase family protein [Candidatus Omnitrophica bacterium]|nr:phenylacetate--CoA ligase family protein [Candidatus Omnitrophota bacterium]